MSLDRSYCQASTRGYGPPPAPPPTYLWEELRRSRNRGGYPWTILDKEPLPDFLDRELLLRGEIPEEYVERSRPADKRSHYRNRLKERERGRRARSEPTPSIPSNSLASFPMMDQAMAVEPSGVPSETEEFLLADEDIPDFVMEYLQSDKGNLDEDIPNHILAYIQSRAAILEKNKPRDPQERFQQQPEDDLYYTENELRILDEARRRLEEQGELNNQDEPEDEFGQLFQRVALTQEVAVPAAIDPTSNTSQQEGATGTKNKLRKFNFTRISISTKHPLSVKLPKFALDRKKKVETSSEEVLPKRNRRPHSASPMRQKITQQLESWNNSLKRLKARGRHQDGQIKSFVALLPGRSKGVHKEPENQYEEVGKPPVVSGEGRPGLPSIPSNMGASSDNGAGYFCPDNKNDAAEETMDDVENLPESEVVDGLDANHEMIESARNPESFVDINIDDCHLDNKKEGLPKDLNQGSEQATCVEVKESARIGLAQRSLKAFQDTKSKLQTSLSKEQLQVARQKLQSTLSKQNLQATHKKVQLTTRKNLQVTRKKLQSTKQNLQATHHRLQTTISNSMKKKKPCSKVKQTEAIIFPSLTTDDREYETSTPIFMKMLCREEKESTYDTVPPKAKKRMKRKHQRTSKSLTSLNHSLECGQIEEEDEEGYEEELEPKMEFCIHGIDRPVPSSVSQSTETLPEDEIESEKENVVIRPKRRRHRYRRQGYHEEFTRPHSSHYEPKNVRSSWAESSYSHPNLSQEGLKAISDPINSLQAVNHIWPPSRKPQRPRRSKKCLTKDCHVYSNVPLHEIKSNRGSPPSSWNPSTWPRRDLSRGSGPIAPKRLKSKLRSGARWDDASAGNLQTWPKRFAGYDQPLVPARKRIKHKSSETEGQTRIHILIDADILFGAESQYIDDDGEKRKCTEMGMSNILTDADTLFGAESRFIDEDGEKQECKKTTISNILTDADTLFGAESRYIDDESECEERHGISKQSHGPPVKYNITVDLDESENKILNKRPLAPKRQKTNSLNRIKSSSAPVCEGMTWPRTSKPLAPRRAKRTVTKSVGRDLQLTLEKPSKELPIVPAPTPSEGHEMNQGLRIEGNTSIQAGLDHVLEILASFPQASNSYTPLNEVGVTEESAFQAEVELVNDENPYAEIQQFQQRKKPAPPRPPPPAYAPLSASSYSYIYTVPRRKHKIHHSTSPERPPRTYCTIRPHRPLRKKVRSSTQQIIQKPDEVSMVRRHSFSGGDEECMEEISTRDLQSSPIVEKMRARPLPPPPRTKRIRSRSPPPKPPRSRNASLRRSQLPQPENAVRLSAVEAEVNETQTTQVIVTSQDEYEPIETPQTIEEVSIGIQTDPLTDNDIEPFLCEETNDTEADKFVSEDDNTRELPASKTCERPSASDERPEEQAPVKNDASYQNDRQNANQETMDECKKLSDDWADELDSLSQVPTNLSRAPQSQRIVEIPSTLQLSQLEVDRLRVKEFTADCLVISSVDASTLQVSQMTSASGQLVLNIGPGVTIPSFTCLPCQTRECNHGKTTDCHAPPQNSVNPEAPNQTAAASEIVLAETLDTCESEGNSHQLVQAEQLVQAGQSAQAEQSVRPQQPVQIKEPMEADQSVKSQGQEPSSAANITEANQEESVTPSQYVVAVPTSEDPSISDLTLQLATISSRRIVSAASIVGAETYAVAQRVAEVGMQQANDQLERCGIHLDEKERDSLKSILLMLLILVVAVFCLGLGSQRLSNHWDFYLPN